MNGINPNDFASNELLIDSMMFRTIQIAENAKKISEEYKKSRNEVPWNAISGIRNRIVHDYGNVDYHIVYKTLKEDMVNLKRILFEDN